MSLRNIVVISGGLKKESLVFSILSSAKYKEKCKGKLKYCEHEWM